MAKKKTRVLLGLVLFLIAVRIALPYILLHYANKSLANIDGYFGHVEDIDLSLYRGAYQIHDMYLNKKDSTTGEQTEFFKASHIDLSIEWKAIVHGSIVGELDVHDPVLLFTKDKAELAEVKKDTSDFRKILKDFMPLKVNRFQVINGNLQYIDKTGKPPVDVSLKEIHVIARNLNNSYDSTKRLPASVTARAQAYEGTFTLDMRLNPLAPSPTFDVNAELKGTNLVLLNDFLQAYANVDVNKGTFGLFTEVAAKDGKFTGYVKPIIRDLDVLGIEDQKDNFFRTLWEAVVGGAGVIFRNQKKDQIATRIELQGSFKDPKTNSWDAIWEILQNAFIQALMPSIDHEISLNSVDQEKKEDRGNLFQRIFSPRKKEESKNED